MDLEFKSLEELYQRIRPALNTKKMEMHRAGYIYIKEEDMGLYLNPGNEAFRQAVTDDIYIDKYLKDKLNMRNRNLYFDNE